MLKNNDYRGSTNILYEKDGILSIIDININDIINKLDTDTNIIRQIYNDILDTEFMSIQNKIFPNLSKKNG